jgi:hypothetical protein
MRDVADSSPTLPERAVVGTAPAAVFLSSVVAALAVAASAAGLWFGVRGTPVPFVTARGETVDLVGQGLYRYDTVFAGAGQHGTDTVVLLAGVPLLVAAALRYRRGSARAGLLLLGMHGFFLYVYGSAALGTVAYNRLFLVYVAIFSAALFAVLALLSRVDAEALSARTADGAAGRPLGIFMIVSGAVTLAVWGIPAVSAVLTGVPTEKLDSYATDVTHALDLGVISPATVLAGILLLRRAGFGAALAVPLLTLETSLVALIGGQTAAQLSAGVSLTPAQIIGPVGGFVVISVVAGWFLYQLLRAADAPVHDGAPPPIPQARGTAPAGRADLSARSGRPGGDPRPRRRHARSPHRRLLQPHPGRRAARRRSRRRAPRGCSALPWHHPRPGRRAPRAPLDDPPVGPRR